MSNNARPGDGADDAVDQSAIWDEIEQQEQAEAAITGRPTTELTEEHQEEPNGSEAEPAQTDAAKPEGEAAPAETPDIWATATPEQKAAFEAAQARTSALEHDVQSQRGRVSALQRKIDSLSKPSASGDGGQKKDEAAELLNDPDFLEAKKAFPEVMAPVEKLISRIMGKVQPLAEKVEKTTTTVSAITEERTRDELKRQQDIVLEQHADYDVIRKSPEFRSWWSTAPSYVKDGVMRNAQYIVDGPEVARLVKQFKSETGYGSQKPPAEGNRNPDPSDKRQIQMRSSQAPNTRGAAQVASGIPDDAKGAWDTFERMGL